ncbi:MAG: Hsp20/alpha crystallin family protein [Bacteriovoracaceae bacterium]|jgi:HSP20 family protein|nr:Hsp20/alpha crystallin family protein [Bacteriovoracaceae bacterium]
MRHYDLLTSNFFNDIDSLFANALSNKQTKQWKPLTQVQEQDDYYHLAIDVPGMNNDDLKIDIHEKVLTVSGSRKSRYKNEEGEFDEVAHFNKSFKLPENSNIDELDASLSNGVLDIVIPKLKSSLPLSRSIEIGSKKSSFLS